MSEFIPDSLFQVMVANMPLVSIDLIVRNEANHVLLGQRVNRPAQDYWFVPGGRLRKGERLSEAFTRLTAEELGITAHMTEATFQGVFEHHYSDSYAGTAFGTHYVVLAFELNMAADLSLLPKQQHAGYRWWPVDLLLQATDVHDYTKAYFTDDSSRLRGHA